MADFNSKLKDYSSGTESFVGASRGVAAPSTKQTVAKAASTVDRSTATNAKAGAIQDIGSLYTSAVSVVDSNIKRDISNQTTEIGDQIFNEYGVGDQSLLQQDITNEPAPSEISKSTANLARLQNAYDRGVVSENSYAARFESVSRQLRARYPGHRDYIDKEISKVSGIAPANTLVRSMIDQANQSRTQASSEENKRQGYLEDITKAGFYTPGMEQMSYTEMIQKTAPLYSKKQQIDYMKSEISLKKDQNEVVGELVQKSAQKQVQLHTMKVFQDVTSPFGKDYQTVVKNITESARSGNTPSEQELTEMRTQFGAFKTGFMGAVKNKLLQDYGGDLNSKQMEEALAPASGFVGQLEDALVNKDYGTLLRLTHEMEAMKTSDDLSFLRSDTNLRMSATAKRVLGDAGSELFIEQSAIIKSARDKAILANAMDSIYGSNADESIHNHIKKANAMGSTDPALGKALIDSSVSVIKNPVSSSEAISKAATALFGVKNAPMMEDLKPEQRGLLFSRVANNEVFKRLQTEAASGNPDGLSRYKSWVKQSFAPLYKATGDEIKQQLETLPNGLKFNEASGLFVVSSLKQVPPGVGYGKGGGGNPDVVYNSGLRSLQRPVDDLNRGLAALKPVLEADGSTVQEYLTAYYPELVKYNAPLKAGVYQERNSGPPIDPKNVRRFAPGEGDPSIGIQMTPYTGDNIEANEISGLMDDKKAIINAYGDPSLILDTADRKLLTEAITQYNDLLKQKHDIEMGWVKGLQEKTKLKASVGE